jgi:UDP-N-acetylglucosamine--N-acetylmuramyl-(pentapeptide) pyrophosphoryl-undecaprenol N-acetylglucosamine transferase
MRVILAGGGTGGHLFPGLAVAREFLRRDLRNSMADILFIGTAQGIEARAVPRQGFKLETLSVRGLKGRGPRGVLDAVTRVPASLLRCLKIIGEFCPDIVIGLGGYASGPMLLAATVHGAKFAPRFYQQIIGALR